MEGTSAAYDARGNMTTDPAMAKSYSYLKTNNQLSTVTSPFTSFSYDALDRLWHMETPTATNYVSDGTDIIAEYDGSNVLQKRYAFDGTGWPLVQYDAAGTRTWLLPDERGSIVATANDSSAMTAINTYDEYGIPGATNAGTFQYASMMWLSQAGLYAPTFRAYGAHHGRFNQTDPIGMTGGINLYAYVRNDPVNLVDPLGMCVAINWVMHVYGNGVDLGPDPVHPDSGTIFLGCENLFGPSAVAGGGAPGLGGGGRGGGELIGGDDQDQQDDFCQGLAEETQAITSEWLKNDPMAGFTTNFPAWNDVGRLNFELNWTRGDLADLQRWGGVLSLGGLLGNVGSAYTGIPRAGAGNAIATALIGGGFYDLQSRIQNLQTKVDALEARIRQLKAKAAGKC